MLKMSDTTAAFLKQWLPEALSCERINDVLDPLDALMTAEGLDENDDPNEFWHEAVSAYDDLFERN